MTFTEIPQRKIVLTTFGSLGDLHPFLALALELQKRGHVATIATSSLYREKVEELGIGFARVRPELPETVNQVAIMRRAMDLRGGSDYLFRELLLPHLAAARGDLRVAVSGADALVFHPIVLPALSVAQAKKMPRIAVLLQPMMLLSAHDPPVVAGLEWLESMRVLAPRFQKVLLRFGTNSYVRKLAQVRRMRRAMNLPTSPRPFFDDAKNADATLALFSRVLAPPQPDWPHDTTLCGFCFHDARGTLSYGEAGAPSGGGENAEADDCDAARVKDIASGASESDEFDGGENSEAANGGRLSRELKAFLAAGEAPIVFTLGSAAVLDAGNFYRESARAASRLNRRAILLCGPQRNVPKDLPRGVAAFDYAPFGALFPRAAAVVHQGGIGTTGQVMRAGVPCVVVPFSHDQPDNAARLRRLKMSRVVPRKNYAAEIIARELKTLLETREYSRNAARIGEIVRAENGTVTACDAIEKVLWGKIR